MLKPQPKKSLVQCQPNVLANMLLRSGFSGIYGGVFSSECRPKSSGGRGGYFSATYQNRYNFEMVCVHMSFDHRNILIYIFSKHGKFNFSDVYSM